MTAASRITLSGDWPGLSLSATIGQALSAVEGARINAGLSRVALATAAGMTERRYRRILSTQRARPETVAKLQGAVGLARRKAGAGPRDMIALRAGAAALVASFYGVTAADALAAPGEERTGDARWLAAARARQAAIYLVHVTLACSQAELGRAFGVSKVAIHLAVRAVEDRRDDPAFNSLLTDAERLLGGEV